MVVDAVSSMMILSELAKSDAAIAHIIETINFGFCYPLLVFGTEEQQEKYLLPCVKGRQSVLLPIMSRMVLAWGRSA